MRCLRAIVLAGAVARAVGLEWIKMHRKGGGRKDEGEIEPLAFLHRRQSHRHCSLPFFEKTNLAAGLAPAASAGTATPRRVAIVVGLARRAAAAILEQREAG